MATQQGHIQYTKNGKLNWLQTFNGPGNGDDFATAIATDNSDNIYITGQSQAPGTFNLDYATIKYNTKGELQWVQRFDGAANADDQPLSIALDANNNVYVTGGSRTETGPGGLSEFATVKYNQTTTLLPPTFTAFGSKHTILGSTNIFKSANELIVANIGITGNDGVEINFKDGEYHSTIGPQQFSTGSKLDITMFGRLASDSNRQIGKIDIESFSDNFKFTPDFSSSAVSSNYTLEIYDEFFNLVARRTGLSGSTNIIETDPIFKQKWVIETCSHDKTDGNGNIVGHYFSIQIKRVRVSDDAFEARKYQLPTGEIIEGGMALYISEPVLPITLPFPQTKINIKGANMPSITISNEWLLKHEHIQYTTVDQTKFSVAKQDIIVSNDSARTFKMRMEFLEFLVGRVDYFDSKIDIGSFANLRNSAKLTYSNFSFLNTPRIPTLVSNLIIDKKGGGLNVTPDFTPVNSPNFIVRGYLNGIEVFSSDNQNGDLRVQPLAGADWINTPIMDVIFEENKLSIIFSENVMFKKGQGGDKIVDRIEFIAKTPSQSYNSFAFVDLATDNITSYILKDGIHTNPNIITGSGMR